MALSLTPNAEKVIADYLREVPEILAITQDRRVTSRTPDSTDKPWVRYTQLNARSSHRSDHLIGVYVQLDCYAGRAGGQPEASLLRRTVRAALVAMPEASVEGAVITGVEIRGDSRQPDPQLDNRERFVISADVWMHA